MIIDSSQLLDDFLANHSHRFLGCTPRIEPDVLLAPHIAPPLRRGKCAVYVFSLSESSGSRCAGGPHRVLKVGKADVKCSARFQSQHYSPTRAPSTLARSLLDARPWWDYLGIASLAEADVGSWIAANTDRNHFLLDAQDRFILGELEAYMIERLKPLF